MYLFLHGFLGQKEDWDPLFSFLPHTFPKCALDLPGHGKEPITHDIALALKNQIGQAKGIIGYSAGGRLALELKARFPDAFDQVIVLSGHPGLNTQQERNERAKIDAEWIRMLKEEPFDIFLERWYSQDLFSSLRKKEFFKELFTRRKGQNPLALATFLENHSLSQKPPFKIHPNTVFMHGEEDLKYAELYRTLTSIAIKNAGHAIHLENPKECALKIQEILHDNSSNRTSKKRVQLA